MKNTFPAGQFLAIVLFLLAYSVVLSAAETDADALYRKAIAAQTGKGASLNLAEGKALLLKAAEAGSGHAMSRLGDMYQIPDGGEPIDLVQARKWFDKAAATNDPYGLLWSANLDDHTLSPAEEKARLEKALQVSKSVALKDPSAVFVIAICYGTGRGAPRVPSAAMEALLQAAGDGDVNAMKELAATYARGDGVPKDAAKAFEWYSKAAETGFSIHLMNLGICYDSGIGVPRDYATALKYYLQAADRGSPRSMTNAAEMIRDGQGTDADATRAAALFQKAVDQGWPPAMYHLGIMYDTGKGVTQNHDTTVTLMRKAAAWNNPRAKKYLADHNLTVETRK